MYASCVVNANTVKIAMWIVVMLFMIIGAYAIQTSFRTFSLLHQYNMTELHEIRSTATVRRLTADLSRDIKIRKHGRKGNVRTRTKRRGFKPYFQQPSLVTYHH